MDLEASFSHLGLPDRTVSLGNLLQTQNTPQSLLFSQNTGLPSNHIHHTHASSDSSPLICDLDICATESLLFPIEYAVLSLGALTQPYFCRPVAIQWQQRISTLAASRQTPATKNLRNGDTDPGTRERASRVEGTWDDC